MKYSKEELTTIAEALAALPPIESAKRHSKQAAVQMLAQEIETLKSRGYTIDQIAEALSDNGLPIATPTLKNYLQRARAKTRRRSRSRAADKSRSAAQPAPTATPSTKTTPSKARFEPTPDSDQI